MAEGYQLSKEEDRTYGNEEGSREAGFSHGGEDDQDQIVKALAEKLAVEAKQVQTFFDALAEMATEQTREAGEFTIPGLGKLVKAERKERMGRNPQTGEEMKIAAKATVKFRVAKAATDAIAPLKA